MKLNPTLLKVARQNSDVLPGNVYPAKGGRKTPGTEFWLVVAVSNTGAHCVGYDRNGNPVSTASYLKSALRERPVVCRVDLSALEIVGAANASEAHEP